MKKSNSESYNRIMDCLIKNENISEKEKMFLVKYATKLYANSVENVEKENIGDILSDLKVLNDNLKECNNTSISQKRIGDILELLNKITDYYNGNIMIDEISYKLDELYLKLDLPVRKKSSMSYNLEKINRTGKYK